MKLLYVKSEKMIDNRMTNDMWRRSRRKKQNKVDKYSNK